jgi:hypothetical protein
LVCGTMSLTAPEALTAGVKVHFELVERPAAKVFSPEGVDIGRRLVSAGRAVAYRRYSTDYVAAEDEARKARRADVAGHLRETLGVARNSTAAAPTGAPKVGLWQSTAVRRVVAE